MHKTFILITVMRRNVERHFTGFIIETADYSILWLSLS